jgi:hypothetical protein
MRAEMTKAIRRQEDRSMSDGAPQNPGAARRPDGMPKGKPFAPGNRANPGGRPKVLREIEAMLDTEHRNVPNMREVFCRLKALAMGEVVSVMVPGGDGETMIELKADPAFMKLYLERVLGPVKDLEIDMSDWPDEVVKWWSEYAH